MIGPLFVDPFGVAADPALARYALPALTPSIAGPELAAALGYPWHGVHVLAIRVTRHKPGRRCLIAYDMVIERADGSARVCLLGKLRAKGADERAYNALCALNQADLPGMTGGGVAVPQAVGIAPRLGLWLQEQVPGEPALAALLDPQGSAVAARIAEALHALHTVGAATPRTHTVGDELHILRERFEALSAQRPELTERLEGLLVACHTLAATLPEIERSGIHRDCYHSNVLVEPGNGRIWLIDLDLYATGDAALDIGNFLAHLTEWSLRAHGSTLTLRDKELALQTRYLELAGESQRAAIDVWTTLALARHITISASMPDRAHVTTPLLALCEQRLGNSTHSWVAG